MGPGNRGGRSLWMHCSLSDGQFHVTCPCPSGSYFSVAVLTLLSSATGPRLPEDEVGCSAAGEPASDPGSLDHAGPSWGQICEFAASTSPRVRRERLRLVRLSEARQTLLPDGAHPPQRSAQLPPATAAAPHAHTRTHTGTQTHMNAHARTPRCRHTGTHVHTCAHRDVAAPRPACCSSSWVEGTPPAYPIRPSDLNSSPSTRRASAPVPTASRAHPPRVTCTLGTQGESSQTSTELEDSGGRWGPAARAGSPGGDLPPHPLQGYPSPVSLPPRKLAGCEPTQCQPQPASVCSSPAAG